jgi:putative endonuclease
MAIHLTKGKIAEQHALRYLKKQGLKLVQQNYQSRFGEIDLIMLDKNILTFVEVRYRLHSNFCSAIESISPTKINRIYKTAAIFLANHLRFEQSETRFDVIGIDSTKLSWIKNAFDVQY